MLNTNQLLYKYVFFIYKYLKFILRVWIWVNYFIASAKDLAPSALIELFLIYNNKIIYYFKAMDDICMID